MAGGGGGTQTTTLRKYLGAIKDTTTVSLAQFNSVHKEIEVAIVKATNHNEQPAKEKYMKAIFNAISAARPRADVAYCIHVLARRLAKTHNWAVALKTLVVVHRAMREVDPTFYKELMNHGRSRSHMLNLSHFKDDSSAYAWDYSAWVRAYALYLEERLECYHILNYDVETDPPKTKDLEIAELLEHLPVLQQLLFRLLGCQPQGASCYNTVIHLALSMVAAESVKLYNAINNGTLNLVDKFFEMPRHDALRALDICRRAGQQAERLSEFIEVCKSMDIGRGEIFLKIEQVPASFFLTMEEYVKDAPRTSTACKDQVVLAIEYKKAEVQEISQPPPTPPPPQPVKEEVHVPEPTDLLGLDDATPNTFELDNKNALALAIVPIDTEEAPTTTPANGVAIDNGTTSWELALVTAPSSNESALASTKLAGGLDRLTLDSLYDDAERRANQNTSYNPWVMAPRAGPVLQPVAYDPFYASNAVAAPYSVQTAAMAQQQQAFLLQQHMMITSQQPHKTALNPFGNSYTVAPYQYSTMPQQRTNAYGPGFY